MDLHISFSSELNSIKSLGQLKCVTETGVAVVTTPLVTDVMKKAIRFKGKRSHSILLYCLSRSMMSEFYGCEMQLFLNS